MPLNLRYLKYQVELYLCCHGDRCRHWSLTAKSGILWGPEDLSSPVWGVIPISTEGLMGSLPTRPCKFCAFMVAEQNHPCAGRSSNILISTGQTGKDPRLAAPSGARGGHTSWDRIYRPSTHPGSPDSLTPSTVLTTISPLLQQTKHVSQITREIFQGKMMQ